MTAPESHVDEHPDDLIDDGPASPAGPPAGSLLGDLNAEIADEVGEREIVYRVGKISRLRARYRALTDDEVAELNRRAEGNPELRRRTGAKALPEIERQNRAAAMMLVAACVELLWLDDDGDEVPLHEFLARPEYLGDEAPAGPMRYTLETLKIVAPTLAETLRDELDRAPNAADVARILHRSAGGHAPLRAYGQLLQTWSAGVTASALEDALEGS